MKKRNWYDLSDKEIEKLENEWKDSKWYERAKKESKKVKPNNGGYYACIILFAIFLLISMVMFAKAAPMGSSDEQSSLFSRLTRFSPIKPLHGIKEIFSLEKPTVEERKPINLFLISSNLSFDQLIY